jgi:hypothetical protein
VSKEQVSKRQFSKESAPIHTTIRFIFLKICENPSHPRHPRCYSLPNGPVASAAIAVFITAMSPIKGLRPIIHRFSTSQSQLATTTVANSNFWRRWIGFDFYSSFR